MSVDLKPNNLKATDIKIVDTKVIDIKPSISLPKNNPDYSQINGQNIMWDDNVSWDDSVATWGGGDMVINTQKPVLSS